MELATAQDLIRQGLPLTTQSQRWADLGAGSGLFTEALASLLPNRSQVVAIDLQTDSMKARTPRDVEIKILRADFSKDNFGAGWDGLLLANSLHYINDGAALLARLGARLVPGGRLLLVEYEVTKASSWVPYPVSFNQLVYYCKQAGLPSPVRLAETPSQLNRHMIYSARVSC